MMAASAIKSSMTAIMEAAIVGAATITRSWMRYLVDGMAGVAGHSRIRKNEVCAPASAKPELPSFSPRPPQMLYRHDDCRKQHGEENDGPYAHLYLMAAATAAATSSAA
jgi:hypothetical protein